MLNLEYWGFFEDPGAEDTSSPFLICECPNQRHDTSNPVRIILKTRRRPARNGELANYLFR
jgi:hypothetical protein